MSNVLRPLTAKEKNVLEFIETYLATQGISPSYQEIRDHFGFASLNSVQRYLKQLQTKNYIRVPGDNQKRAITLLHSAQTIQRQVVERHTPPHLLRSPHTPSHPSGRETLDHPPQPRRESLSLPLLGRVAAGQPLEAFNHDEFVDVPAAMLSGFGEHFALTVKGQSMVEEGILDGDLILVRKQDHAKNGDIVVASVDNEATVKRFYLREQQIELRPANSNMRSLWFTPEQVKIQGVVAGLIRKF